MKWQAGDLALITNHDTKDPKMDRYLGEIAELIRFEGTYSREIDGRTYNVHEAWRCRVLDKVIMITESVLRPIPGEKGSWDQVEEICGWSPFVRLEK